MSPSRLNSRVRRNPLVKCPGLHAVFIQPNE